MDNPNFAQGPDNPTTPLVISKVSPSPLVAARDPLRKAVLTNHAAAKAVGMNFSVGSVCQSLRRRWIAAFFLASFLMAAGVTAAWFGLQPNSTARATLQFAPSQPRILFATAENSSGFHNDSVNYQKTQATLLRSRLVWNAALKLPNVAQLSLVRDKIDILDWLERQLQVDTSGGTEIIRVSLSGDEPRELVVLLDAIVKAYTTEIDQNERAKKRKRLEELVKLNNQYDGLLTGKKANLRTLEENGAGFTEKTLAANHQFTLERLSNAKKELIQCRAEIYRMKAGLVGQTGFDRTIGFNPLAFSTEANFANDSLAAKISRELADKQEKLEKNKKTLRSNDPRIKLLENEVKATETALEGRRKQLQKSLDEQNKARLDEFGKQAEKQIAEKVAALVNLEKTLVNEVLDLTGEARLINQTSLRISRPA